MVYTLRYGSATLLPNSVLVTTLKAAIREVKEQRFTQDGSFFPGY